MVLTLKEAARDVFKENPRTLAARLKRDNTIPRAMKGRRYLFIQEDLETWIRSRYTEAAKRVMAYPSKPNTPTSYLESVIEERREKLRKRRELKAPATFDSEIQRRIELFRKREAKKAERELNAKLKRE